MNGSADLLAKAIEVLEKSDELYSNYGLIAGSSECGKWINSVRDLIRESRSVDGDGDQAFRHTEIGYRLVEAPEGDRLQYYQEPA